MKRRHRTIFLITALILIPVFFGLIPLNLDRRLASGAPLAPVKHVLKCSPCLFHSVTSHAQPALVDTVQYSFTPRPAASLLQMAEGATFVSFVLPDISPLRC